MSQIYNNTNRCFVGHSATWVKTEKLEHGLHERWDFGNVVWQKYRRARVYGMAKNISEIMHDKKMEKNVELEISRNQGVSEIPFSQSGVLSEALKIQKYDPFMQSKPTICFSLTSKKHYQCTWFTENCACFQSLTPDSCFSLVPSIISAMFNPQRSMLCKPNKSEPNKCIHN